MGPWAIPAHTISLGQGEKIYSQCPGAWLGVKNIIMGSHSVNQLELYGAYKIKEAST